MRNRPSPRLLLGVLIAMKLLAGLSGRNRNPESNGNTDEGFEFGKNSRLVRSLDAGRASGDGNAILDLRAQSRGAPDDGLGRGEIQRGQVLLWSAHVSA